MKITFHEPTRFQATTNVVPGALELYPRFYSGKKQILGHFTVDDWHGPINMFALTATTDGKLGITQLVEMENTNVGTEPAE